MMHIVKKIVHVKIEKLVKITGETIRRCCITVRFIFIRQRLTIKRTQYFTMRQESNYRNDLLRKP